MLLKTITLVPDNTGNWAEPGNEACACDGIWLCSHVLSDYVDVWNAAQLNIELRDKTNRPAYCLTVGEGGDILVNGWNVIFGTAVRDTIALLIAEHGPIYATIGLVTPVTTSEGCEPGETMTA